MAGSSTAELRLRPTGEADLDYVVAAEANPDNAPFLAPSSRAVHLGFLRDPLHRHLIAEAGGRHVGFALLRLGRLGDQVVTLFEAASKVFFGMMAIINTTGRMQTVTGTDIFAGSACAFSSASDIRL